MHTLVVQRFKGRAEEDCKPTLDELAREDSKHESAAYMYLGPDDDVESNSSDPAAAAVNAVRKTLIAVLTLSDRTVDIMDVGNKQYDASRSLLMIRSVMRSNFRKHALCRTSGQHCVL